tara:strand:- start:93 stop:809 length:717 start_codon:yes stop_codon:yes gene_type:complete
MKKLFLLGALFLAAYSYSQTIVITSEQEVMPSNWSAYLELHDQFFGDVTFNEGGGVVVQRIRVSDGKYTMRRIRYGKMNNWGISSDRGEFESSSFWRGLGDQVKDWGPNYASKSLFYQGGGNNKNKFAQVYEAKVKDPQAFLNSFKTWLNENKKVIKDRWINVAEFTIAGPNGATHAVTITAENWIELEQMREAWLGNAKSAQKFFQNRGEVIDTRNFLVERLRHYNNDRIKAGTTKD